jgi:predicted small metal-binding protein
MKLVPLFSISVISLGSCISVKLCILFRPANSHDSTVCRTIFVHFSRSHNMTRFSHNFNSLVISCNLLCHLYFSFILRFYSDRNYLFIILKFQDFSFSLVEVKLSQKCRKNMLVSGQKVQLVFDHFLQANA